MSPSSRGFGTSKKKAILLHNHTTNSCNLTLSWCYYPIYVIHIQISPTVSIVFVRALSFSNLGCSQNHILHLVFLSQPACLFEESRKGYFFFLRLYCMACRSLVPQPGFEPVPPALGTPSLNHWTTREVQKLFHRWNLSDGVSNSFHSSSTHLLSIYHARWVSQVALVMKNTPANAGDLRDTGLIPGSGRSSGGGHGNPLQYSCLENPIDRGAW